MIKDLVSIIIPVYNRENLISDTANSVLNQNYSNIECIIIDDQSTDNTFNIVNNISKKDSRVKVHSRPYFLKKGANSCRNYGYKLSRGEYIIWFDSDDIMTENSISSRINLILDTKFDFVIGRLYNFESNTKNLFDLKKNTLYPLTSNPASEYITGKYWFQTSVPLFRQSFLENFKKHFDKSLSFHDEAEFFVRLLLSSPAVNFTEEIVTLRRMHNDSGSYIYNSEYESEKLFQDHFGSLKIWNSFKKSKLYYDESIHSFYNYYFKRWCIKMKYNPLRLLFILILGLRFRMFDSPFKIIKIVFWRIFKEK